MFGRLLHFAFLMTRGMTLGVRAIVRSNEGKFLLVRHTYTSGWHFPGGGVEHNQTLKDAIATELKQETGLELSQIPKLHGVFLNRAVSKRDHVFLYLCQTKDAQFAKPNSREIAELGFFGVDELPNDIDAGTARRIDELVRSQPLSECW